MKQRTVVATGTYPNRRRLTLQEAENGDLPEPFTAEEWKLMAAASRELPTTS